MRLLLASLLLAAGSLATAAPPPAPAELTAPVGKPVLFSFTLPEGAKLGYAVAADGAKAVLSRQWAESPTSYTWLVFANEGGEFRIVWWTVGESTSVQTVVNKGAKPDDGKKDDDKKDDDTKPLPPDPIVPTTPAKFHVLFIEDTDAAVSRRGQFLANASLAARFKEKGHSWRAVDQAVVGVNGSPPADIATYLADAKGKPLPMVYLIDKATGKERTRKAIPADWKASDLTAFLAANGG